MRQKSVMPTLRHIIELRQKDGKGKKTAKPECKRDNNIGKFSAKFHSSLNRSLRTRTQ